MGRCISSYRLLSSYMAALRGWRIVRVVVKCIGGRKLEEEYLEEEYLDKRASYLHRYEAANQNLQAKRAAHIA